MIKKACKLGSGIQWDMQTRLNWCMLLRVHNDEPEALGLKNLPTNLLVVILANKIFLEMLCIITFMYFAPHFLVEYYMLTIKH